MRTAAKFSIAFLAFLMVSVLFYSYEISRAELEIRRLIQDTPELRKLTLHRVTPGGLSILGEFDSRTTLIQFLDEVEKIKARRIFFSPHIDYPTGTAGLLRQNAPDNDP